MRYRVTEEWKPTFLGKDRETFIIDYSELTRRFPDAIKSLQTVSKVILNRIRLSGLPSKIMIEKIEEDK
ncbi:hypothetical protein [Kamptonema sp. UHCC 0994]|uniref:hypothetical protein n=1 Tax=Kamptonema sp. UHCC 0994 TaxID=3031329 RepID=UPI0023BA37FA|nr:hypothetical protein [Kamptonema sp. UHCC 0994]MDF0552190.1 hypothetical protein [Kamptonema sp. UHCC 0994]